MLANERDQLGCVARLAHDLEAGPLEQAGKTFAEEDVVVCQHHPRPARRHSGDYGVPSR
jgi:hypothetical protein